MTAKIIQKARIKQIKLKTLGEWQAAANHSLKT